MEFERVQLFLKPLRFVFIALKLRSVVYTVLLCGYKVIQFAEADARFKVRKRFLIGEGNFQILECSLLKLLWIELINTGFCVDLYSLVTLIGDGKELRSIRQVN